MVTGFKTSTVGALSDINDKLGTAYAIASTSIASAFHSTSDSAEETFTSVSETASSLWANTALGVEARLANFRAKWKDAFEGEEGEEGAPIDEVESTYSRGQGGKPPKDESKAPLAVAAAAMASAVPVLMDEKVGQDATEDLMILTRKLIEIRSILLSIGEEAGLTLPSIVVVGSQSSGKSSVLEAIVGKEFLPKCVLPSIPRV